MNSRSRKVQKECPDGKVRNPKTGRCINIHSNNGQKA